MSKDFYFEVEKTLPNNLGRAGIIHTPHGEIKTPAFMVVGTMGEVRNISNEKMREIHAQAMLSNGFHLRKKSPKIAEAGGLAKYSGWNGPTLTDSGGFQVMSLGSGLGKVVSMERAQLEGGIQKDGTTKLKITNTAHKDRLAKVSDEGVNFVDPFSGEPDFIGPEESMQIQCRIGADIHMAFDELTSLADTYEYNIDALKRTEEWAERSLREHINLRDQLGYRQSLYGVLQGGRWEDLRRSTAKNLGKLFVKDENNGENVYFDGFGLGGAFLKEDLGEILRWCNEELPYDKPRHLLGLSHPDDIFIGAEMGADTFDCVAPTREARHGRIYSAAGEYNLRKFNGSNLPLDEDCDCPTCQAGYTRGDLRALWKSGDVEKKREFYQLVSVHNVRFIIRLTEKIRESIINGEFEAYKRQFLNKYYD